MSYLKEVDIEFQDNANLDAFGRLKVAEPQTLFDAQFTYGIQPLLFEPVTPAGCTITHDATNRRASIAMSSAAAGVETYLQSFEYFRYQPGKSQEINITFNMGAAVTDVAKYVSYGDAVNAFAFAQLGTGVLQFQIGSGTGSGNQLATQANWNIDKLDGTGKSGKTLNITYDQILYIDFQALYVGRVRFGFVIDGILHFAHEFDNANTLTTPYIQTANLPIRIGMVNTGAGTVSATMYSNCCMVASSGGIDETVGYEFSTPDTSVTAGNGTRTHLISLRPKTTFNSITNRTKFTNLELELLVTGNNPVYWEMCLGQAFSVAPTYANVNSTYSAFQYGTGGTLSGSPAIVIDSGYVAASATVKSAAGKKITDRYPITLNAAGAVRSLGTLTLLVTGLGGTSVTRAVLKHKEIR